MAIVHRDVDRPIALPSVEFEVFHTCRGHVGAGASNRRRSMGRRIAADSGRGIATSAIWSTNPPGVMHHLRTELDECVPRRRQSPGCFAGGRQSQPP